MAVTKAILEKWMVAQKRHRLSDKQVQMARELGLNPDKLGKIDNHRQESWKAPLPQFIESIYFKRFKREEPETVKPLKQIMAEMEAKKKLQKEKKEERRKQRALSSDSGELASRLDCGAVLTRGAFRLRFSVLYRQTDFRYFILS